jgi:hypothetical protein
MNEKHPYDFLVKAFQLNTQLHIGCENSEEVDKELKTHLYDLKDLLSDLESLIDDI